MKSPAFSGTIVEVQGLLRRREALWNGATIRCTVQVGANEPSFWETTLSDERPLQDLFRKADIERFGEEVRVFLEVTNWADPNVRLFELDAEIVLNFDDGALVQFRGFKRFERGREGDRLELLPIGRRGRGEYGQPTPRAAIPGTVSDVAAADIAFGSQLWDTGILTVAFRGGSDEFREQVAQIASEWTEPELGYIRFYFRDPFVDPPVFHEWPVPEQTFDIRIDAENRTVPNASYLGVTARFAPADEPTMWLGHAHNLFKRGDREGFRAAVLHEFGHALGFPHAHQDDRAHVDLNWNAIYERYGRSLQTRSHFAPIGLILPIAPSPETVMRVPISEDLLLKGKSSPWRLEKALPSLTEFDKTLVRKAYPLSDALESGMETVCASAVDMADAVDSSSAVPVNPLVDKLANPEQWSPLRKLVDFQPDVQDLRWKYWTCWFCSKEGFTPPSGKRVEAESLFGAGIFVEQGVILTANHVIPDMDVASQCKVYAMTSTIDDSHVTFEIKAILCSSPELDYSVLEISDPSDSVYFLNRAASAGPAQRQRVHYSYFYQWRPDRASWMTGFSDAEFAFEDHRFFGCQGALSSGMSGGPIAETPGGKLLGIHHGDVDYRHPLCKALNQDQPFSISIGINGICQDIRERDPSLAARLRLLP